MINTEGQYRYPEPAPDENHLSPSNCYNCKVQPHCAHLILLRHHFVGTHHSWSCQSYFYFGLSAKWFYESVRAIQILQASLYHSLIKLAWQALNSRIFLAKWGKKVSSFLYSQSYSTLRSCTNHGGSTILNWSKSAQVPNLDMWPTCTEFDGLCCEIWKQGYYM